MKERENVMQNVVRTSERVDVIHAYWGFKGTAYGCSNCGHGAITPFGKYCEECGAKMDGFKGGGICEGVSISLGDIDTRKEGQEACNE